MCFVLCIVSSIAFLIKCIEETAIKYAKYYPVFISKYFVIRLIFGHIWPIITKKVVRSSSSLKIIFAFFFVAKYLYPSSLSLLSYLTSQFEIRDASGEYYVWFYFCVCLSTSLSSLFKESCVLILLFPKHKESFLSPKQSRAEVKEENYPQMELYKILSKYSGRTQKYHHKFKNIFINSNIPQ